MSGDVERGYGPGCISASADDIAFPYQLQVHYASRGAMGHTLGAVHILRVDASGAANFEMRPAAAQARHTRLSRRCRSGERVSSERQLEMQAAVVGLIQNGADAVRYEGAEQRPVRAVERGIGDVDDAAHGRIAAVL